MSPAASPRLVLAAALRVECAALRWGLSADPPSRLELVRAGFRAHRRRLLVESLRRNGSWPLAVAGVAGALRPELRPGDVVVATEVRRADRVGDPGGGVVWRGSSAAWFADALRGAGFTVHLGPIVTADRLVAGARRAELAVGGALAVDLESGRLLAVAGARPAVVLRAVADTPRYPLWHPGIVVAGYAALRTLAGLGAPLLRWAAVAETINAGTPEEAGFE